MANILTTSEASKVLRCETTDVLMLDLLPAVDTYIKNATGRDWAADSTIYPEAKSAARILIALWHENPMMIGGSAGLPFGLSACLVQLEVKAIGLATAGVPEDELEIVASMPSDGESGVAISANLILVFSHAMAGGTTSAVALKDVNGNTVACTNTLDATATILTINPTSNLAAGETYSIVLTDAPDTYGQTLTDTIQFGTAG